MWLILGTKGKGKTSTAGGKDCCGGRERKEAQKEESQEERHK